MRCHKRRSLWFVSSCRSCPEQRFSLSTLTLVVHCPTWKNELNISRICHKLLICLPPAALSSRGADEIDSERLTIQIISTFALKSQKRNRSRQKLLKMMFCFCFPWRKSVASRLDLIFVRRSALRSLAFDSAVVKWIKRKSTRKLLWAVELSLVPLFIIENLQENVELTTSLSAKVRFAVIVALSESTASHKSSSGTRGALLSYEFETRRPAWLGHKWILIEGLMRTKEVVLSSLDDQQKPTETSIIAHLNIHETLKSNDLNAS